MQAPNSQPFSHRDQVTDETHDHVSPRLCRLAFKTNACTCCPGWLVVPHHVLEHAPIGFGHITLNAMQVVARLDLVDGPALNATYPNDPFAIGCSYPLRYARQRPQTPAQVDCGDLGRLEP